LRLLLEQREAQAAEQFALLRTRAQEGEHLSKRLSQLQEQLDRSDAELEPASILQSSPAPATPSILPAATTQEERWLLPCWDRRRCQIF
jgi:hypothetical protein